MKKGRGRPRKAARGLKFEVALARESIVLLQRLAKRGIYGRSAPEVGGRFIEQALQAFVDQPRFRLEELTETIDAGEQTDSSAAESK